MILQKTPRELFDQYVKFENVKSALVVIFIECAILILYVAFGVYTNLADASNIGNSIAPVYGGFSHETYNIAESSMFQDIHVMVFMGFGFLMVFLKKYYYSSVGFNFLLAALMLQWNILCKGFFDLNDDYKIEIGVTNLYNADIATATVLISMGAVLGRTSHIQLLIMGIIEAIFYNVNAVLNEKYFKGVDVGGSITIHVFGAYFGLAASYILARGRKIVTNAEASYTSNLFATIGTIFLWVYWPSFNAINLEKDQIHRAIINTYLALTASCIATFAASQLSSNDHKLQMVHIQNSTLAGGVAVGACAHLMLQPFGAILLGIVAGLVSVYGYSKLTKNLDNLHIFDTCGVHNLHGLPGLIGGLFSILLAFTANEELYGQTLYEIYPARADQQIDPNSQYIWLKPGYNRSAVDQAKYQAILLVVTMLVAISAGIISGLIMNFKILTNSFEAFYDDSVFWVLPAEDPNILPNNWESSKKNYNLNLIRVSS